MNYSPQKIEKKWQKIWEKIGIFKAEDSSKKPKKYILVEFPYPSGEGLHVGHVRSYSALDAVARKKRMEGYNVLYPIGWDAFGLPTENYAIRTGIHPKIATAKNIKTFKRQLKSLGISFDWSREIDTADPKYYKWTQWIFLKLFGKGLAYQADIPINFCPKCKIGLADEEVIDGKHERCGKKVTAKKLKQWMLKITRYADRLIEDLKKVDYLEKIKVQQINWIGRSEGAIIEFRIKNLEFRIPVFTTRPDTLFGAAYLVVAPEHPAIENWKLKIENWDEVRRYIERSKEKTELERVELIKEKTGIELKGIKAVNPANKEEIPIFLADYVLAAYGTGAVMAVPGHDERDFEFAGKYKLPIKKVIQPPTIYGAPVPGRAVPEVKIEYECWTGNGILINSGQFSGMDSEKAKWQITKAVGGKKSVNYHLRDWVFSRQHYWGEPIPIIHCQKCGQVPVPEKDLPVELPYVKRYQPTKTGESPLAAITDWVNARCPKCKAPAKRETDTMPNWAGSNWYYMRYCDPGNDKVLADQKKLKYWLPVDWYNGGWEHTTLHLLYSRFIYKFLYDIDTAPTSEPYQKRTSHGIVLAEDGRKMSKSFGNVINPDDIIKTYGADTLRLYEMFMGPFDQAIAWNTQGVKGVYRFLNKAWDLVLNCRKNKKSSPKILRALHKLNKKIDQDLESTKFNTAVAAFMEFVNLSLENKEEMDKDALERFLILLSSFAPHLTEELWQKLGHKKSIFLEKWPKYDPGLIEEATFKLVVQVNGKTRDVIEAETGLTEKKAEELALRSAKIKKRLVGEKIKKTIFVKDKLINLVI